MHEEALLRDLRRKVDELARAHGSAPIVRAHVALGALAHLDEPRLRALWSRAMAGGPAAGARLDVELLEGTDHPLAASVVLRSVTFADPADREGDGPAATDRRSSSPPSP